MTTEEEICGSYPPGITLTEHETKPQNPKQAGRNQKIGEVFNRDVNAVFCTDDSAL